MSESIISRSKSYANLFLFVHKNCDIFETVASKMGIVEKYKAFYFYFSEDFVKICSFEIKNLAGENMVLTNRHFMYFPKVTASTNIEEYLILVFVFMWYGKLSVIADRIKSDRIIGAEDLLAMSRAYAGGRLGAILLMKDTSVYKAIEARLVAATVYTVKNSTVEQAYDVLHLARYLLGKYGNRENRALGEMTVGKHEYQQKLRHVVNLCFSALVRVAVVHAIPFAKFGELLKHLVTYSLNLPNSNAWETNIFLCLMQKLYIGEQVDPITKKVEQLKIDINIAIAIAIKIYKNCPCIGEQTARLAVSLLPNRIRLAVCDLLGQEHIKIYLPDMMHHWLEYKMQRAGCWPDPRLKRALAESSVRRADLVAAPLWNQAIMTCQPQC